MNASLSLLRKIGMDSRYTGYPYFAYGISLTINDSNFSRNITKGLYKEIGAQYGVSNSCVEAAIRTLVRNYWNKHNDSLLFPLLGYSLYDRPTASELISILADFLREHPDYCN